MEFRTRVSALFLRYWTIWLLGVILLLVAVLLYRPGGRGEGQQSSPSLAAEDGSGPGTPPGDGGGDGRHQSAAGASRGSSANLRPIGRWESVPVENMPRVDVERALEKAREREKNRGDGVYRFAEAIAVEITPENAGVWEQLADGSSVWRLRVRSEEAQSLNLGFRTYRMPPGGSLAVFPPDRDGERPIRDFTAQDNEAHGELWTPLMRSDELALEVVLPPGQRDELALKLSRVNHGFRGLKAGKIGGDTSGACNIDVACSGLPDPVGPLIGLYADQIRSVGAYTLGGVDFCSGALINNTNNDNTPYFLTAEHCTVSPANAASMVVYFNFQNSTCRPPDSPQSGGVGDGDLTQFSSGAIHRAESAASDFCLVELDDPIPASYNVFFAGWDQSGAETDLSVAIHHPGVAEKRISFEFDPTTTTSYSGTSVPGNGTHVRVSDWDHGTTEGGSSGSPLFDDNGRIIGQLHGGGAACGNDLSDWYGRVSVSWSGGGTSATRLSDWLDPAGTALTTLDGINQDDTLSISDASITEGDSGVTILEFTVTLARQSSDTVTVQFQTFDGTAEAGGDYLATSGVLTFNPVDAQRVVQVTVNGDTTPENNESFEVRLSNPTNAVIQDGVGVGTILTDDFLPPVITSSLTVSGFVGTPFTYQIAADNTPTGFSLADEPAGMTVNGSTGEITWTPAVSGPATVTITASNPAGSDSETLSIDVGESLLTTVLDTSLGFVQGPLQWIAETGETHDGVDAARSPAMSDGQTAYFETQITAPADGELVSFWWKVSSELGYDFLRFLVDDVLVEEISGEVDWAQVTYPVSGGSTVTLRWEYAKDGSVSDGLDAGFVDELALASADPRPYFTSAPQVFGAVGESLTFDVEASGAESFGATNLPGGLALDPATGIITGTPLVAAITVATVTAYNSSGSREQELTFIIGLVGLPLSLDADLPQVSWSTQGDALWRGQTDTTHDGVDAAQSGDVNDGESTTVQVAVDFDGAQDVRFWWKVSSESGFDFLDFRVGGVLQDSISGEVDWTQRTGIAIPAGPRTLSWVYDKDGSVSSGDDTGWVDEVVFTYRLGAPANVVASEGRTDGLVRLSWDAVAGADSYRVFRHTEGDLAAATEIADVSGLTTDDTTAEADVSYHYWVRAFDAIDLLGAPDGVAIGSWTHPFTFWADGNGLAGGDAGPTAAPYGDGVENLIKYAFNMDGSGPDNHVMTAGTGTSGLPIGGPEGEGPGRVFRFEFVRRIGAGVGYTPQLSRTLQEGSWVDATASPVVTPIDSEWERVVIEEPVEVGSDSEVFGRVRVSIF